MATDDGRVPALLVRDEAGVYYLTPLAALAGWRVPPAGQAALARLLGADGDAAEDGDAAREVAGYLSPALLVGPGSSRADLRALLAGQNAALVRLQKELADAASDRGWDAFGAWLGGSDPGAR